MRLRLLPHPHTPCDAVDRIEVTVVRVGARLGLHFVVAGQIDALALPAPAAPERADALWRRTCFEAFARPDGAAPYREFNLSPSSQWAAYDFDGYRAGMRPTEPAGDPGVVLKRTARSLDLSAAVTLAAAGPVRVGLAAVIEAADGGISYWALAHPPGKPDFHHPDCFTLALAATGAA